MNESELFSSEINSRNTGVKKQIWFSEEIVKFLETVSSSSEKSDQEIIAEALSVL